LLENVIYRTENDVKYKDRKLDPIVYNTLLELYLYHEQNETKIQDFKKSYTDGGDGDEYDIFPPDEELCKSFSEKINNLLEKPCYQVDEKLW